MDLETGPITSLYTKQFLQLLNKSGKRVKRHTWKNKDGTINIDNQKIYARYLGEKLGYETMEDWYKITVIQIQANFGLAILALYPGGGACCRFLTAVFPDYDWCPWKFASCANIWKDKDICKKYCIWLGKELGYTKMEDWYQISMKIIIDNYGRGILPHYKSSAIAFVIAMFPDYDWLEWKFNITPSGFWPNKSNQKRYAIWLGKELGYTKIEDWYQISSKNITDNYGVGMRRYQSIITKFVMEMFPDHDWLEWKFNPVPAGFWKDKNNRKRYAIWLGKELGYTKKEDWYKLSGSDIQKPSKSGGLFDFYRGSPSRFVMEIFSDYDWLEWKFNVAPMGFWKDKSNRKRYAIWLGKELGYTKFEDWYKIKREDIENYYGGGLFIGYYHGSISQFVIDCFNHDYEWEVSKFRKNYSYGQIQWLEYLMVNIPNIRYTHHVNGEFLIPGSHKFIGGPGYHADGFSKKEHMIYEYLGDFYHGNPAIYNPDDINTKTQTTFGELYNKELKRQKFCEDSGFGYHSIWESEWHRGIQAIVQLQRKFKNKKLILK